MVFYGKSALLKIGAAVSGTPGTSATDLYTQVTGTDYSGDCKEVTINPGDHGVEVLNVFGNQLKDESRPAMVTANFTMVYTDVDIFGLSFATASTAPSGFTRYQGTDSTGARTDRAIVFKVTNASATANALMNNANIVAQGEITLAADGHAEQTFSAACLVKDYFVESG